MNRLYKTIVAILKPIVRLLFRYEVRGIENIPKQQGNFMLCCNHQSFLDVVLLAVMCPYQINFMAKKELFKFRPLGWLFKKVGAFPVNRGAGDVSAVKHAEQILKSGGVLGIFPEGTRNPMGTPGRAKAGAAMLAIDTGANVLPVAIRYSKKPILFKKVSVRIGTLIDGENFAKTESISKTEIKRVTGIIMENITNLWEMEF